MIPDSSRLLRAASALCESGKALRMLAPEAAEDLNAGALALAAVAAALTFTPPPARPKPAPEPPRRTRLVTGAQQANAAMRADEWLRSFIEAQPEDSKNPSARVIFAAAAQDKDLALPRRVIDAAIKRQWPLRVRQ